MEHHHRGQPGHPLDLPLEDSSVLAWFVPTVELLVRRAVQILPFAALMASCVWLLPSLSLAGPFDQGWRAYVDTVVHATVVTAIMVLGYAVLARTEGTPWGQGVLAPWRMAVPRVLALIVFWCVAGWLASVLVGELLMSRWLLSILARVFALLGAWGVYLFIALVAPLPLMLATVQMLSYIHAVRSEAPLGNLLVDSFVLVFGQPHRFVRAYMLIAFLLCVLLHLLIKGDPGRVMMWVSSQGIAPVVFMFVATAIGLAWWFVAERALRPELGLDTDVGFDIDADPDAAAQAGSGSPMQPAQQTGTAAAGSAAGASTLSPEQQARQLAELERAEGPVMAARRLVAWLRGRRLSPAGYPQVRDALADLSALPDALAGLALEWREVSRPGELPFVVGEGLRLDRVFLMDQPDQILSLAKRLGVQNRHDLAARLLLPFLDRHKPHPDHAEAGVQMARILAFNRDKPEAGLRLLDQLAGVHPDHPAIVAMIRQLRV